jgi:hypothetical protein
MQSITLACLKTLKTAISILCDGEVTVPFTQSDPARRSALEQHLTDADVRVYLIMWVWRYADASKGNREIVSYQMAYVQTANPSVIKKAHAGERIAVLFFLVVFDTWQHPVVRAGVSSAKNRSL